MSKKSDKKANKKANKKATLYERLGGAYSIASAVDLLVDRKG